MFKTDQEAFWAGEFGDEYIDRNTGADLIASNLAFFVKIIERTIGVKSIIEFGSNRGLNLQALRLLMPKVELSAIEINSKAVSELQKIEDLKIYHTSIFDFQPDYQRDMALIKGVLIHINPDFLPKVYELLYASSKKYICMYEYYNPTPLAMPYRGHEDKLYKRDFAGEMMDMYQDLELIDNGFIYNRDNNFLAGSGNWFLMQKRS